RSEWHGRPATDPDAVYTTDGPAPAVYVSWNGATEVESWRLLAGEDQDSLEEYATVSTSGFETAAPAPDDPGALAIAALDAGGEVLTTTAIDLDQQDED